MSTGNIVNLNQFRKAKARKDAKAQADANAVKFGRTKSQKELDTAREELARKRLDDQQFDE